ncbi:NADH:ubiquinone oxidoreductase complex I intermediate-associated protein 30 [Ophiocordyceps camponoti-floridani]|uniref:NADH:ubiquinone oxidoreductase complex I intermediate-associated protein 30 n=1 Tax=Ophiocordyceps camponoti-floridani TaxID=2030778 RepID=A0A8H4QE74_9HYPO|nr:NADH:ubiquinone oxidoreductase complex I intermediate-associated protein 30 [Ophiocordyceps camponoti-floridani]
MGEERLHLFGGDKPWRSSDWEASDDRVRNGKSHSTLTTTPPFETALFTGHLDTRTLGAAGFASQRTSRASPPST